MRKKIMRRVTAPRSASKKNSPGAFDKIFSHSGAMTVAKIANIEMKAAKARLRKLGIDPEDPLSEDDPESVLN
jgi:hypothetical protein